MPDFFLQLPPDERREALGVAAASSGRPMHLLDKDVWVVWVLEVLFQAPFATHLVFKGGSSLSKAYQIIRRFSEDVDLTYDIRVLAPDLVGGGAEPLPPYRSQEKRWTKEIRTRLPLWISDQVVPLTNRALSGQKLSTRLSTEGEKVFIEYEPVAKGSGYTRPTVMLEFGARSTGEPCETPLYAAMPRTTCRKSCSGSKSARHASGTNFLGESHSNSYVLRARGIPRWESLRAPLA
jgi:hypothetical protein